MKKNLFVGLCLALASVPLVLAQDAAVTTFTVAPSVFDPATTDLVQALWLIGLGCPTNAGTSNSGHKQNGPPFTDPACPTGDSVDTQNEGLLLVKTGPTPNNAAATATINGLPKKITLSELGYDIRKPNSASDSGGSHCGAGAPRFNVKTKDGNFYFIGCNSPSATTSTTNGSTTWIRLRWGNGTAGSVEGYNANQGNALQAITSSVTDISIVFDEGSDTGPDNFGAAILDNIDINGVLVGQGTNTASN